MSAIVEFDPELHRYTVEGVVLPSVTTILKLVYPIRGAMQAAARGTEVHRLTECYDLGQTSETTPELVPYVYAYVKFRRDYGFEPLLIEQRVYHPVQLYAGTLDRIGEINGHMAVLDLKTSQALRPMTGLQLAAYKEAWNHHQPDIRVSHRYALRLTADGDYELKEYADRRDYERFQACQLLTEWLESQRAPVDYDLPLMAHKR